MPGRPAPCPRPCGRTSGCHLAAGAARGPRQVPDPPRERLRGGAGTVARGPVLGRPGPGQCQEGTCAQSAPRAAGLARTAPAGQLRAGTRPGCLRLRCLRRTLPMRPRGGRGLRHHPAAQRFLTPASRAGPSSVPLAGVPRAGGTALTSCCARPPSLSGRPGVLGRSPRSVHVRRRHRQPHRLRRNVGSSHGVDGPGSHAQRPARRPGRGRAGRPPRAHAGPCAPRPARRRRGARPARVFPASPPPLGLSLPCLFLKKQGGRGDRLPSRPPSR